MSVNESTKGTNMAGGFRAIGRTGATAKSRYAGATASGAPLSGNFVVGDFIVDQTGLFYVCTVAGSPGTWVSNASSVPANLTPTTVTVTPTKTIASATSAVWDGLNLASGSTATVSGVTAVTTATGFNAATFYAPSITNASAAITSAATVAITGAPSASGTLTSAYALWVQAGQVSLTPSATVASAASAAWDGLVVPASTLTVTGSTAITTATGVNLVTLNAPTITSAGSPAITAAATLAIAGAPAAGGSATITSAYALWVQAGQVKMTPTMTVASAAGAVWDGVIVPATTLTLSGSTNITTAGGVNLVSLKAPTISAASALTVTTAATLAIAGPPTGGGAGPATLTTAYSLFVAAGIVGFAAQTLISSASAQALTVGRLGTSNPAFTVDASTGSCVTGVKISAAAAAGGVAMLVTSSGSSENLTIAAKGTTGTITFNPAIAVPAGGSAAASILMSSTAALGLYYGSGAPTVSAAQGSLYMRTDGSSTSTRVYVNSSGSTTWVAVTTAS